MERDQDICTWKYGAWLEKMSHHQSRHDSVICLLCCAVLFVSLVYCETIFQAYKRLTRNLIYDKFIGDFIRNTMKRKSSGSEASREPSAGVRWQRKVRELALE